MLLRYFSIGWNKVSNKPCSIKQACKLLAYGSIESRNTTLHSHSREHLLGCTTSPLTTNQRTSSGWVLPVICSKKFLLQSDLAGERSQFAAENKTASERTFVRFFSTKHGSLRITVGRWLPKETPIRSAPQLGGIYLIPITRRGSP
ncbi:hypothetical protein L6164_037793 [Bauhinia variegata]|uniref:Uncharacterized protein n=1 Tax=Bauhinia variegata TaxID=167791 RepID=A0ACB9KL53_BAUVA|nr:hypothetical protein L6164_037793 [Bauhinia variegata]